MSEAEKDLKIRGVTLRVAVFFGLTTFTLCIAIFYIESILDDTQELVNQKDSTIEAMQGNILIQQEKIEENINEIHMLKDELKDMRQNMEDSPEN